MKLQNRASLVALFLLCLSVPTIGCRDSRVRPDGKRVVKVAYLPITHALPVFAEKEELDDFMDKYGDYVKDCRIIQR